MLCTDIQIEEGVPDKAFIKAWNRLVDNYKEYLPALKEAIDGEDVLSEYRAKKMIKLIEEYGHIDEMLYELMLRTLSHIEIGHDGFIYENTHPVIVEKEI